MSLIAGIEFQFDLNFQEIDLQETESYLRDITSKYSDIIFGQQTDIRATLEEGSLKATLLVLGTLYIAIGQYESFRSGIDYMINDAKSLKDLVSSQIVKSGLNEASIMESKRIHTQPAQPGSGLEQRIFQAQARRNAPTPNAASASPVGWGNDRNPNITSLYTLLGFVNSPQPTHLSTQ